MRYLIKVGLVMFVAIQVGADVLAASPGGAKPRSLSAPSKRDIEIGRRTPLRTPLIDRSSPESGSGLSTSSGSSQNLSDVRLSPGVGDGTGTGQAAAGTGRAAPALSVGALAAGVQAGRQAKKDRRRNRVEPAPAPAGLAPLNLEAPAAAPAIGRFGRFGQNCGAAVGGLIDRTPTWVPAVMGGVCAGLLAGVAAMYFTEPGPDNRMEILQKCQELDDISRTQIFYCLKGFWPSSASQPLEE